MDPKEPNKHDNKSLMRDIIAKVGREKAIDLVMQSYNTELLTSLLSRLEDKERMIGGYKRRDHLESALRRVVEVCELT